MRPLRGILRLARERRVVVVLPGRQLQDGLGREPPTVGQFLDDVLGALLQNVARAVDPRDLGRRLAAEADALQLDLAVLGGHQEVALDDLGRIGRHQHRDGGEAAPDARLTLGSGGHLALVTGVVVQHYGVDF